MREAGLPGLACREVAGLTLSYIAEPLIGRAVLNVIAYVCKTYL
jgi:hypothetical protein